MPVVAPVSDVGDEGALGTFPVQELRGHMERSASRRLIPSGGASPALNRLAELAARLLGASSAQVSLLTDVQTVVGGAGLAPGSVGSDGPLSQSLCTVTAVTGGPLVVTAARSDDRVARLPPVTSGAVGAYLGVPLTADNSQIVGALCAFDPGPREWSEAEVAILQQLAASVVAELELSALTRDYEVSRARWELAINAAGIGSFDLDLATGRLSWDDRLLELFGYDEDGFDNSMEAFNARLHPDDLPRVSQALATAIETCGDYEAEYRVILPDRDPRWVQARGCAVCDETGTAVRLLGAAYETTARREAQQQAERAAERATLLAGVTAELAGTLDAEEAVARLSRLVVPTLADWCVVTLVDDDAPAPAWQQLRDIGWWHADPPLRSAVERYAASRLSYLNEGSFLAEALATGRMVVISENATRAIADILEPGDARDLIAVLAPETAAVLPLRGNGRTLGLLTLFSGGSSGHAAEVLDTAVEVAARAGLALDNARLYDQQRRLAEGLQRSLLTAPPEPDHMHIVVRYEPAAEAAQVGGDWYDAFLQPDGATMLVIGDVVGHDTEAAGAMSQVRGLLRGIAATTGDGPAGVLARLDAAMELLQVGTTATAVVARLEQTDDERERGVTRLRWSNAGHPPPMAINADGSVVVLAGLAGIDADLLLGIDPATSRTESEVVLDRGSTVLLYTDGLVERRGQPFDEGMTKLRLTLGDVADRGLDELCDEVLARMLPARSEDDVALAAVRLHRQDRPRPAEAGPKRVPSAVDES